MIQFSKQIILIYLNIENKIYFGCVNYSISINDIKSISIYAVLSYMVNKIQERKVGDETIDKIKRTEYEPGVLMFVLGFLGVVFTVFSWERTFCKFPASHFP